MFEVLRCKCNQLLHPNDKSVKISEWWCVTCRRNMRACSLPDADAGVSADNGASSQSILVLKSGRRIGTAVE